MKGLALLLPLASSLILIPAPARAGMPIIQEPRLPHLYGRVVLDRFSSAAGVPPVGFDHWRHRAMFTCRVCHVDVGFAFRAGETQVSSATNRGDLHCGACHNGKTWYRGNPIFASCSESGRMEASRGCTRCHVSKSDAAIFAEYQAFTKPLPVTRSGGVDWQRAEGRRLIQPMDHISGVSVRPDQLRFDRDLSVQANGTWLGNIVFSHKLHTAMNGCEACHPELFPSTRQGAARYDMAKIGASEYCGVCHNKVAFPIAECQRCHRDTMR